MTPAQGAVMIQMIPWGWQLPDGTVDRECMFSHQAEAVGARYFHWLNTDRLKSLQPMCAKFMPVPEVFSVLQVILSWSAGLTLPRRVMPVETDICCMI